MITADRPEPRPSEEPLPTPPPIPQARFAIWIIFSICLVLGLGCLGQFLWLLEQRNEVGELYREERGAWPVLTGCFLRAVVAFLLAWSLGRYLRALRRAGTEDRHEAFEALRTWWNLLAVSLLVVIAYWLWQTYRTVAPSPAPAMSQRYRPPGAEARGRLEFRIGEEKDAPDRVAVVIPGMDDGFLAFPARTVYLLRDPLATRADIADCRVVGRKIPAVEMNFAEDAFDKIAAGTRQHKGKTLVILLDGEVISGATITDEFRSSATLTGKFAFAEADRMARAIAGHK